MSRRVASVLASLGVSRRPRSIGIRYGKSNRKSAKPSGMQYSIPVGLSSFKLVSAAHLLCAAILKEKCTSGNST